MVAKTLKWHHLQQIMLVLFEIYVQKLIIRTESWELENGKKSRFNLAFQKVAKTGNIGKKCQWQAISIM